MRAKSSKLIALSTLAAITATTFGVAGMQPAQAKRGFVRRHPFLTAGAAALVYHHYHKKRQRQRARAMRRY